jgi:hypothetical protein
MELYLEKREFFISEKLTKLWWVIRQQSHAVDGYVNRPVSQNIKFIFNFFMIG